MVKLGSRVPKLPAGDTGKPWRYLLLVYILFIYITLPYIPIIWKHFKETIGIWADLSGYLALLVTVTASIVYMRAGIKFSGKVQARRWVGLAGYALVSSTILLSLDIYPAERLHLAEYGILALVAVKAMRGRGRSEGRIYILAVLVCFAAGLLDEIIQGFITSRDFQLTDILLNFASSLMMLYLLGFVARDGVKDRRYLMPEEFDFLSLTGYPLILFGSLFTASQLLKPAPPPPDRPNIILLTVDALRPDHLGCYGYRSMTSPNIDRIAGNGVLFKNAYSSSAWTSPNVVSILTGMFPSRHGVVARGKSPRQSVLTLPEILRTLGYYSPDLTYLTNDPNFYFLGLDGRERRLMEETSALGEGEAALAWLRKRASDGELSAKPFFLWHHSTFVHLPYPPLEGLADLFLPFPLPSGEELSPGIKAVMTEMVIPSGSVDFFEGDELLVHALYDAGIKRMDEFVGRMVETLEDIGEWDNTIFIITADHGEELLEHGHVGHASTAKNATLYEEVIRIPLIVHYPTMFLRGAEADDLVQNIDILPTLAEYLRFESTRLAECDGVSFLSLLRSRTARSERNSIFCETNLAGYQAGPDQESSFLYSVTMDRLKLIAGDNGETVSGFQGYDLQSDPSEMNILQPDTDPLAGIRFKRHTEKLTDLIEETEHLRSGRSKPPLPSRIWNFILSPFMGARDELRSKHGRVGKVDIISPEDGSLVSRRISRGILRLKWTGDSSANYIVEYRIGDDEYRLEGTFPVEGNKQEYGPFNQEVWGRMRMYNPWNFRIWRERFPDTASEWVTFNLD